MYVVIFYVNYFWLVPKYLFKGKIWFYLTSIVITVLALYFLSEVVNNSIFVTDNNQMNALIDKIVKENHIPKFPKSFRVYEFFLTSFLISGFSAGLRMSNRFLQNEKEKKELEKERLNSELAFLKNQISPHFFFNTLNNIYSLVQINTEDAQRSILKLSKMMRYLLYESEHGNIQLSQEIEFMKNYLDLMKLRLTSKVDLKVSFPEKYTDITIPPLLFIPFVENALKHGISYRDLSFVHINLNVNNHELLFTCNNSIASHAENTEETYDSGIGLENIKKRLMLLFPGKHTLLINQVDHTFQVQLNIILDHKT